MLSAIKMNEVLVYGTVWRNTENMLGVGSLSGKDKII